MVFKRLMKLLKKKKTVKKTVKKNSPKKRIKVRKPVKKAIKAKSVKKAKAPKETLIGEAIHYFSKIKVAIFRMKGSLAINERVHVKGYTTDFTQNAASMQIDHKPVDMVKKGQEIGMLVKGKVRHKDKLYRVG